MNTRFTFYRNAISDWLRDRDASVLIVGGGPGDRDVFVDLGFKNVVISNVCAFQPGEIAPYDYDEQNAESLTYTNDSFDFVIVHAALHHCSQPHRALLEMYRVAKRGIVLFEPRDSLVTQIVTRLGVSQTYEHSAVFSEGCQFGGVNNTDVPNYVYRWNEREVEKTIKSYAPGARHRFHYKYGHDLPALMCDDPATPRVRRRKDLKRLVIYTARPFYELLTMVFPKQQNLFAAFVEKPILPRDLQPWLTVEDGRVRFDERWGRETYRDVRQESH